MITELIYLFSYRIAKTFEKRNIIVKPYTSGLMSLQASTTNHY